MGVLNVPKTYDVRHVVAFFDSRLKSMRTGGFAALAEGSPAAGDPAFWAALMESPYDDVRTALVERLQRRRSLPGAGGGAVPRSGRACFSTSTAAGGRSLPRSADQRRRRRRPEIASTLLPVVAVAIRSVRAPEARHGWRRSWWRSNCSPG